MAAYAGAYKSHECASRPERENDCRSALSILAQSTFGGSGAATDGASGRGRFTAVRLIVYQFWPTLEYYVADCSSDRFASSSMAGDPSMTKIFNAKAAAEEVARALVNIRASERTAHVSTPVTYPTGSHVVVRLDGIGDRWFVSDDGYGSLEASLMNAMGTFRRVAPGVAERAGIAFDQRALFVVEATRGELPGAVVAIANASAEAVRRTAMRMEEIRYAKSRALFDERVAATFRGETIIRQPEIVGMSGRPWEFSAGIERRGDVVYLLDLVSPRPNAIYATISKFTDMKPELHRKGAAILTDIERTDSHLISLLSRVAGTTLSANEPEEVWRRQIAA
jgi:hypothetical protein